MVTASELLKESIKDLKSEFSDFSNNYHKELIKIWIAIKELETKQKILSTLYGALGGALPASIILAWIIIKGK